MRVSVIIPALNEELTIGRVIEAIPKDQVHEILVADNGSSDRTAEVARQAGARVVSAPRRGYGSACLAGIAAMDNPEVVVFLDGDFSDDPTDLPRLLAPIERGEAELVIGSRVLGNPEPGALQPQQRFGNALATRLIHLLFGARFTDLGPFRAITRQALERLEMGDPNYGWTVEMQVKAARLGVRFMEVPVHYRKRGGGKSKVSGTLWGSLSAGRKILLTIFRYSFKNRKLR
ncbi:MAG: putative glycosyltransferase [bacterium]|nr:putative glycosyltransferase [bacterium]